MQQCAAHLVRHLQGVLDIGPQVQQLAAQVQKALRDAAHLVERANTTNTPIDAEVLADGRWRYDQGVLVGISINLVPRRARHQKRTASEDRCCPDEPCDLLTAVTDHRDSVGRIDDAWATRRGCLSAQSGTRRAK